MLFKPMSSWTRFLGIFDLFKYKFYFRIGTSIENSTIFSIFISLLVLAPLTIYFILIANNTINHTAAKTNVQEFDVNQRPNMTLNSDNFRLAVKIIQNTTAKFSGNIDDYFDITIGYYLIIQTNSTYAFPPPTLFTLEACQVGNFEDYEDFYNLNLRNAFCLSNHSMEIGGYFDESTIRYFEFDMATCGSNYKNKTNCLSPEIVQEELAGAYFYVYIESQDVDSSNYKSPLKRSLKSYFQLMDFTRRKEFQFYMEQVQLDTYDNMLYNTNPKTQYFNKQMDMVSDSLTLTQTNDTSLIRMQIFSSNKIQQIERTYQTLIEAAAIVGGISSFVIVLGAMISFLYNDMRLKVNLMNTLYNFDLDERKNTQQNQNKKENIKLFSPKPQQNQNKKENIKLFSPTNQKSKFRTLLVNNTIELNDLKSQSISKRFSENDIDIIISDEITKNDERKKINYLHKEGKKFEVINAETFPRSEKEKVILTNNVIFENDSLKNRGNNQKNLNLELSTVRKNDNNQKNEENNYLEEQKQSYDVLNSMREKKSRVIIDKISSNDEKYQEKSSKLHFSTWELLCSFLMPFFFLPSKVKMKYKLFQKACEYLMKYINLFYLIRMVDDVQKMKSILLNNHQIALFNYISKPIISLQEENAETQDNYLRNLENILCLTNNESQKEEIVKEIMSYYQELRMNGNWSLIDMRLFDYLNEDFKKTLKTTCSSSSHQK